MRKKAMNAVFIVPNNVVHRLRFKAQLIEPEEPVHKISLEIPVIQYLALFLKFLPLDTKIKFNHSLQHL
jgi:hypothetical protein